MRMADANLRPGRRGRRPRRPARRAVDGPGGRPPRGHPRPSRRVRRLPGLARPPDRGRAGRPRHRAAVPPPGRGDRGGPRGRGRRRRHADGVGQDAVLHAARSSRPSPTTRRRARCSCSRPRRSARTRSTEFGELSAARRDDDLGLHLRRRHAGPDPVGGPRGRPGRRHEPGHAPLGDPPAPHEVVPAVRAAPGHRHRRAAHLPGRVRQPRRQRPPPAAAHLRPLRQPPGHRLLLGHDREPGRAGDDADRPARCA